MKKNVKRGGVWRGEGIVKSPGNTNPFPHFLKRVSRMKLKENERKGEGHTANQKKDNKNDIYQTM